MMKWLLVGMFATSASRVCSQVLKKPIPDKLVVLTFDDAVKSHYINVAPVLKQYGFGATFFICEFPPDFADTSKYMTWPQIKQLSEMGFEIGNHTRNHVDVDKTAKDKLVNELKYIEEKCIALQILRPVSFAYPGYNAHPAALKVLEERGYLFARTGGEHLYDPLAEHPSLVPSFTTLGTNTKEIMHALSAAKDGKIAVLTIHGVPDTAHPWVSTPPELFAAYMKYMHDNHYKVIAMNGLLEYINTHIAVENIQPVFPAEPMRKRDKILFMLAGVSLVIVSFYSFSRLANKRKR